jgi:drug/metabolite transporter (DMT)-like permease
MTKRSGDNPARAIAIMIAAQAIFAVTDAIQKLVMETTPLMTVVWTRFVIFLVLLTPLVIRQPAHLARTPERPLVLLRAMLLLGSMMFMAGGLLHLPLATATALVFIGPFIVTVLAVVLLREQVGWRRWLAIAIGFAGMLMIVRPGSGEVGWAALFILGSTTCWSAGIIVTRQLGTRVAASTYLVWQAVSGVILTAPLAYAMWQPVGARDALLLLLTGVLNLAAQFLTVRALQQAPASVLAPLSYTLMVWATLLGWQLFDHLPDAWTLAGTAVIILSGLYVWHRERIRALERDPASGSNATSSRGGA